MTPDRKLSFISIRQVVRGETCKDRLRSSGVSATMGPGAVFPDAKTNESAIKLAVEKAKRFDRGRGITYIEELGVPAYAEPFARREVRENVNT